MDSFRALTKRFQYHQKLVNGFWKHWHADYLKSLTPLKIWYKIGRAIYKGDLVLVSEDHGPHTGCDGLVRSVTLWTPSVIYCSSYTCLKPVMLTCLLNLIELYDTLLNVLVELLVEFVDKLHVVMHSSASGGSVGECSKLKFYVYFV